MIGANIGKIRQQLPGHVKLIAVSKTKPIALLREAYDAGQRAFGENKVQELVSKQPLMPPDTEWHLIGHLQKNKVKYIAPFVHLIHAVDSLALLDTIQKEAAKNNRVIPVLLQVYIAREESKFGLDEDELNHLLKSVTPQTHPNVSIQGLMGIATNTTDELIITQEFSGLKNLFDHIAKQGHLYPAIHREIFNTLSMGMSNDYTLAITCGSNMIRVGSLIFGEREYPEKQEPTI